MDNGGDILQLCRLCLVKDDVNIPIFEEQGDIRQIFLKISSCLPVKVNREDKLPKKICDGCSYKLDMFYEFWNGTANAEKQLLAWLGEAATNKLTDSTVAVETQQIKPVETVVKQEEIDPSDIHTEENDDDKSYMFPKISEEEPGPSATATSNDEPPPKRARRTAAVKAQIAMDPESDDDEDSGEPLTKIEDESEESEGEDHEPTFVDVPSTSADDQPGPSGVGKDGAEGPLWKSHSKKKSVDTIKELRIKYSLKECYVMVTDVMLNESLRFVNNTVKLTEKGRRKYTCYICWKKFLTHKELSQHKTEHQDENDDLEERNQWRADEPKQTNKAYKPSKKRNTKHDVDDKIDTEIDSPLHKCETCEASFNSIDDVKKHPPNKCKFLCGVCNRAYNTIYAFTVHILHHKISVFKSQSTKSLHKCSLCPQSFQEYYQLKTHGVLMHKIKNLQPANQTICDKDINSSNDLSCELCYDMFSSRKDLEEHMEFHKQLTTSDDKVNNENNADETVEGTSVTQSVEDKDTTITKSEVTSLHTTITILEDVPIKKPLDDDIQEINDEAEDIPVIESTFSLAGSEENSAANTEDPSDDANCISNPEYESLSANKIVPVDHYRCKKCDRIYMSLDEFNDHIKNQKCTIVQHCKLCKQIFDKNSDLFSHITQNHRHLPTCKFCFESFYVGKKLDEHKLLYHFKTFKNLCKICFQCFASFQEFNTHLKEHLNV